MQMLERIFVLNDADPIIFFGLNNKNIQLLKDLHPKLRIIARGNLIKVMGEEEETSAFISLLRTLERYTETFNSLSEEVILAHTRGGDNNVSSSTPSNDVLIFGLNGKPISPRNENQKEMVRLVEEHDLVFATGPAGTGKTFMAIALAVKALKNKTIRKIILSRPAVEAGEKLGFLPGEMKDKLDPYLQPLYDALGELIPPMKLKEYMEMGVIQIAPLAFMRGRTLSDAIIILDEAQNTSPHQIKMFLTRLGNNAKMIITGDMTQIDLPAGTQSGLKQALYILRGITEVGHIDYNAKDIVRHPLVKKIVNAYDKFDKQEKAKKEKKESESSKTSSL